LRPGNTPEEIGRPISITFQIVVRKFSEEEHIRIIEMLWEVTYSDGLRLRNQGPLDRRDRQFAQVVDAGSVAVQVARG
jgi:uncharacterized tellurite resistance protein B-like protein